MGRSSPAEEVDDTPSSAETVGGVSKSGMAEGSIDGAAR